MVRDLLIKEHIVTSENAPHLTIEIQSIASAVKLFINNLIFQSRIIFTLLILRNDLGGLRS
tara:strand:+ start:558 stop:740 length:183 start_codon:yes stop_codon:yes gene_type:complete